MILEDLRVAVSEAFADTGRAPEAGALAERFGTTADVVLDGLRQLARARHLVLDSDDRIVMAHPFASIPLGFSVMGTATLWWGGCAWDWFALPHLLPEQSPMLVATNCPACHRAHARDVGIDAPPDGQQVAHFLVPVARMWDDLTTATPVESPVRPPTTCARSDCRDPSGVRRSALKTKTR